MKDIKNELYLIKLIVNLSAINTLRQKCAERIPWHLLWWQISPSLMTETHQLMLTLSCQQGPLKLTNICPSDAHRFKSDRAMWLIKYKLQNTKIFHHPTLSVKDARVLEVVKFTIPLNMSNWRCTSQHVT